MIETKIYCERCGKKFSIKHFECDTNQLKKLLEKETYDPIIIIGNPVEEFAKEITFDSNVFRSNVCVKEFLDYAMSWECATGDYNFKKCLEKEK